MTAQAAVTAMQSPAVSGLFGVASETTPENGAAFSALVTSSVEERLASDLLVPMSSVVGEAIAVLPNAGITTEASIGALITAQSAPLPQPALVVAEADVKAMEAPSADIGITSLDAAQIIADGPQVPAPAPASEANLALSVPKDSATITPSELPQDDGKGTDTDMDSDADQQIPLPLLTPQQAIPVPQMPNALPQAAAGAVASGAPVAAKPKMDGTKGGDSAPSTESILPYSNADEDALKDTARLDSMPEAAGVTRDDQKSGDGFGSLLQPHTGQSGGDGADTPPLVPSLAPDQIAKVAQVKSDQPATALAQPPVATLAIQPGRVGHDLGVVIARRMSDNGQELTVRLDPISYGQIEVKMHFDGDGQLRATVSASNPATLDMLRRESADLSTAMSNAGISTDSQTFQFDSRRDTASGQGQQQREAARWNAREASDPAAIIAPEDEAAPVTRLSLGGGQINMVA